MQITLNKVPFNVAPVEGRLREAILTDPLIAAGIGRDVWEWSGTGGRWLVPVTEQQGLPLPTGLLVWVPQTGSHAGANGAGLRKAEGPSKKMAERFLSAVGATTFPQVMQAIARVTGIPQKKLPFASFAALRESAVPYRIRMETAFSVLELANPARNLQAFVLVPGLVSFAHALGEAPEGAAGDAPASGTIRPGFVIPPLNQATHTMRRMAVARRLTEIQAELGETKPADLLPGDPRRAEIGRLGAEWKVLQTKPATTRAA